MADLTRVGFTAQKKGICMAVVHVVGDVDTDFVAGNHLVLNLPPRSIILNAYVHVLSPSNAGIATLGTTATSQDILINGDTSVLGMGGTFGGQLATDTGTEIHLGIDNTATTGEFIAVIEYLEYTKNTGEFTKIT